MDQNAENKLSCELVIYVQIFNELQTSRNMKEDGKVA